MEETPTVFISLLAGLLSFLSPCVLPLVPAYIGYLSGSAVMAARGGGSANGGAVTLSTSEARWIMLAHAMLFVIGFTVVFALIGRLAGGLSLLLAEYRRYVEYVSGVILIIFGLFMIGVLNIPFFNYTRRLELRPSPNLGYLRSFVIGLGFGVGWTPCIGPTLGLIFTLAMNGREAQAFLPFVAYSIGLGIPFVLTAMAMGQVSSVLKKLARRSYSLNIGSWTVIDQVNIVSLVSGALMIVMGVLIFTNSFTLLAPYATPFFGNL